MKYQVTVFVNENALKECLSKEDLFLNPSIEEILFNELNLWINGIHVIEVTCCDKKEESL